MFEAVVQSPADASAAERPAPTLERMLRLAAIEPPQAVAVAGHASLAVMVGLCRKGFAAVTGVRDGACTGGAGEHDVLILTGPAEGEDLAAMIGRGARLLADRGVLVAHEVTLDDDPALARSLEAHGFEVDWTVHDMAGPCLVAFGVHRRAAAALSLAA